MVMSIMIEVILYCNISEHVNVIYGLKWFHQTNHSRTSITLIYLLVVPYMDTLITEQTLPLNLHQKTTPEHI
jgi:hypothetical protein